MSSEKMLEAERRRGMVAAYRRGASLLQGSFGTSANDMAKMLESEADLIETQISSTLPALTVTQYLYPFQRPPGTHRADNIYIERVSITGDACWAIRCFGERLVRNGHRHQWEFEPSPSDRSDEWKERAAFTLPAAVKALEETLNPPMPELHMVIKGG